MSLYSKMHQNDFLKAKLHETFNVSLSLTAHGLNFPSVNSMGVQSCTN